MSSAPAKWWQVVLGLLLIVCVAGAAGLAIRWLFQGLQKEVGAALVAGLLAVGGSMLTVVLNRKSEHRKAADQQIRERSVKANEEFLKACMSGIMAVNKGEEFPSDAFQKALEDYTPELMMWGSEDFIKKWAAFRTAEHDTMTMISEFAGLVLALRRDFGQRSKNLDRRDVLRLFVNDLDDP